jgi:hypothetical protein
MGLTPGDSSSSGVKLPPWIGRSRITFCSMTLPRPTDAVCNNADCPVTVTVSVVAPTCSATLRAVVSLTPTANDWTLAVENPASSTVSS